MKRWLLLRLSWVTGLPDWMSLPTGRVQPWQEGGRCCASTLQVGGSGRAWQNAYLWEESSEQLVGNTSKKRTRGSCSQHVECHQLQHCALQEGEGTLTWPVCNPADKSTDTQTHTALMNHGSHMECTQDGRTYEGQWASALSRTWRTMHWSWALQDASQGQWKAAWHGCGDNLQGQPRNLK